VLGDRRLQKQARKHCRVRESGERGRACCTAALELEFCSACPRAWTVGAAHARPRTPGRAKIADAKQVGRLVGDVMKTHKGQVDASEVKRVAEEMLKG
jgi:hypothetical protein